jgi:NTP pyrophosphatase (non-canonical NTP hydrolase)
MVDNGKEADAVERMAPLFVRYVAAVRGDLNEQQTNLGDLLADLMHFAKGTGLDFDEALASGERHFREETDEVFGLDGHVVALDGTGQ